MPSQNNITNIPSARVDFIDQRTGLMSREWYRFFLNLFNLTGAGNNPTSLDDLQVGPPSGGGESTFGTVTSIQVSGGTTGLTTSGGPITSAGTITLAGTLAVTNGGTGATTASAARTNLGLGTMATQNANSVSITGGALNGVNIGNSSAGDGTFDVLTTNVSRLGNASGNNYSIGTLTYTPANALISVQSAASTYNQIILQNSNGGTASSADFIVNNDLSTDTTYYGDFGMNSSTFTGTGAYNQPNYVYLTAKSTDLAIGTIDSNSIHFVVNSGTTDAMTINASKAVGFNGSYGTLGQVLTSGGSGSVPTWTTPATGTVTSVSVASANGFAGSSSGGATPTLTLSTSVNGLLKGNGTAISAATAGTDYSAGTSALSTGILKSTTSTGALTIAVAADFPTLNQNTTGTASNVTGTVAIANGGTGATTASAAFNALSPVTATGDLIIGNGTNSSTRLPIGANSYVLTSNGTTATWAASTGGVTSFSAGTTGFTPSTGTTGAVTLAGTLNVANGGTGLTSLTANYIPYGNGTSAFSNSANFAYNGTYLRVGAATPLTGATNPIVAATGSANQYIQSYAYNTNAGTSASADFVAYADNSTDSHGWADMGFTSSTYADATYTVTGKNEAYLFGSAPTGAGATGNMVYATDSTGSANAHQFYVGGFTQAKAAWKAQVDTTGLKATQVNATNGFIVNSMTVSANYTIATGDSAMSVGPMTIASGVSVTVSSGSRWVVI